MANIPTRLNNPGDLKDPTTGKFRVFTDPTMGFNALKADLKGKITGNTRTGLNGNSTLAQFASIYAPSSDNNDPVSYAQKLASKLGVTADTPISKLSNRIDDFASAIADNEGYQGNRVAGTSVNASPQQEVPTGTNPEAFRERILQKFPNGVAADGTPYAKMDAQTLTQKIVSKYPDGVTKDGVKYSDFLSSTSPTNTLQTSTSQNSADQQSAQQYGALFPAKTGEGPLMAGVKAVGNLIPSAINTGKGLFGAIMHPLNTVSGIADVAAGEVRKGVKALGVDLPSNQNTNATEARAGALNNSLYNRYGTLENAQRSATNDPFGVGSDVLGVLEGGAGALDLATGGSKAALAAKEAALASGKTAVEAEAAAKAATYSGKLESGLSKISDISTAVPKKIIAGAYDLGTGIAGKALGVEGGTIREGINSAVTGGDAYKSFVSGLSGETSQADLVDQARNALGEVVNKRSKTYQDMLGSLKSDTSKIDLTPIKTELQKQLDNFNITKNADGTLNFDESTLGLPSEQSKISHMVKDVENWKNNTPKGIDTLKQRIANYWEPGTKTGAFSEGLRQSTRGLLDSTPGYTPAMKTYGEMTEHINDIKKGLSLGDNAMVETTFKKLTGAFRQNNEFRSQLIKELDQATGGKLLPKIAGQQMSSFMPRGLAGTLETVGGVASLLHGGTGVVPLLFTAMATSPKVVGTFIRTLHLPAIATQNILKILNKVATPAILGGNALNRATIYSGQR